MSSQVLPLSWVCLSRGASKHRWPRGPQGGEDWLSTPRGKLAPNLPLPVTGPRQQGQRCTSPFLEFPDLLTPSSAAGWREEMLRRHPRSALSTPRLWKQTLFVCPGRSVEPTPGLIQSLILPLNTYSSSVFPVPFLCSRVVGRVRAPEMMPSKSFEPAYRTLCGNRDFASVVQLRILIELARLS